MNDFIDFLATYLLGGIEMLIGFHFFTRFLGKRITVLFYLLFVLLGLMVITLCPSNSILEFAAYILLLTLSGILFCKANSILSLLYAMVTIEIMQLSYGIFNSIFAIISPFFFTGNPEITSISIVIFSNILSLFLSILCYQIVCRYFTHEKVITAKYALMIYTPAFMIFLVSEYIHSDLYGNIITIEADKVLPDINHYQVLLIQISGIASLFCIMVAYHKLLEGFELTGKLSLLEQEACSLHQYVEEAKSRYEKTKSFRHDIKNHITIIKELIQKDRNKEALQYIGEMATMMADMSFPCSTNNPVLDILIGNKLGIAQNYGIDILCTLLLPSPCGISDMDLCIILSNALDNAISGCNQTIENNQTKEPFKKQIQVTGSIQGDFLLIEIENSYYGSTKFYKGTGMTNMNTVAEKYHGAISVKVENSTFILSVLLIIPQQSECISQQNNSNNLLNSR